MCGRLHAAVRFKQLVANGPSLVQRFSVTLLGTIYCSYNWDPPRQKNRSRRKTASRPEEPPANQNDGSLPRRYWRLQHLLLDGHGVCYWTAAALIVCGRVHRLCYFYNTSKSFFNRHGAGRFFRLDAADLLQTGGVPS
jgi:hypothetical protein